MKLRIMSRAEMENQLEKGFEEETAVISFYDPESRDENYAPVDYSGQEIRLFQLAVRDADLSTLEMYGLRYNEYFPESDTLAEFILKAVNDDCEIICQCDYGQSRSAACAAAILEHFEKKGIEIFADDSYIPNQLIYNKLICSLKRVHTEPTVGEVFGTMRKDRFYSYIERADKFCTEERFSNAFYMLDTLLQIASSEMGENSLFTAYVYYHFARIYRCSKKYDKAEEKYRKAIEICILHKQNRVGLRIRRSLAMMFNEMNDKERVVSECRSALDEQVKFNDKIYAEKAREMYGDALFSVGRYKEAIMQWLLNKSVSKELLCKISDAYEILGDTGKSEELLHKSRMADKAYLMHKKRIENIKEEIERIRSEVEEV